MRADYGGHYICCICRLFSHFSNLFRTAWIRTQGAAVAAIISLLIFESLYFQFLGRRQQLFFSLEQHIFSKVTVHPVNCSPLFSFLRRMNLLEDAHAFLLSSFIIQPPPPLSQHLFYSFFFMFSQQVKPA